MAISSDSLADSRRFATQLGLAFPLLSDEDVAVAQSYGVAMQGADIAIPATIIVMPDRSIFWKKVGESKADRPEIELVLEQVDAALASSVHAANDGVAELAALE